MTKVWIPSPMQSYTQGAETVEASGKNVRELINALEDDYPGIKAALVHNGMLRQGVAVAVNGNIVQKGLLHPLTDNCEVFFVPAVGGGRPSPHID